MVVSASLKALMARRNVGAAAAGPSVTTGMPHVAGVVTDVGEVLPADLVVDAMGRRSPSTGWLTALGARPPQTEVWGIPPVRLASRTLKPRGTATVRPPG